MGSFLYCVVFVCILCFAFGEKEDIIVENGTVITVTGSTLSYVKPDGEVVHTDINVATKEPHEEIVGYTAEEIRHRRANRNANETAKRDMVNGVITGQYAYSSTGFSYFQTQWEVPLDSSYGTRGNFYSSLSPYNDFNNYIQCSLSIDGVYGAWSVQSVYKINGAITKTLPVAVKVTDTITGEISYNLNTANWNIKVYVNGILKTFLAVNYYAFFNGVPQLYAKAAFDIYQASTCVQWPVQGRLTFSNVLLRTWYEVYLATASWQTVFYQDACDNNDGLVLSPTMQSNNLGLSLRFTWALPITPYWAVLPTSAYLTDMPGNTLSSYTYGFYNGLYSVLECAKSCDLSSSCKAWVSTGTTCILKSAVGVRQPAPANFYSGVKLASYIGARSDIYYGPSITVSSGTVSNCAAYCNGEISCQSWGFDTSTGKCSLYTTIGKVASGAINLNLRNGVKGMQYTDRPGMDMSGSPYVFPTTQAGDPTRCAYQCQTTTGCTAWVYTANKDGCSQTPQCWLKTGGVPAPVPNACYISGTLT